MAELAYFVDDKGPYAVPASAAAAELDAGAQPASTQQIAAFQARRARREKYDTAGQAVLSGLEGAGEALTLGGSDYIEKWLGVDPEGIKDRSEFNPISHGIGTGVGILAPALLTGGTSALAEGAELTAPSLISRAARGVAEALEGGGAQLGVRTRGLLPEATTALGAGLRGAVAKGLGGVTDGALSSVGDLVHDAAVGSEIRPASALKHVALGGGLGGVLVGGGTLAGDAIGELAEGASKRFPGWLDHIESHANVKTTGGLQDDVARGREQLSREEIQKISLEGGELGLVSAFATPESVAARSDALRNSSWNKMSQILAGADAKASASDLPNLQKVLDDLRSGTLKRLRAQPEQQNAAEKLESLLDAYRWRYDQQWARASQAAGRATFTDMHTIGRRISDELDGYRSVFAPSATAYKDALHDFLSGVNSAIDASLDRATAALPSWKNANREYQIASKFGEWAEQGKSRAAASDRIPLTTILSGIGGGAATGTISGTLATAAADYAARKYGASVVGAVARGVRTRTGGELPELPAMAKRFGEAVPDVALGLALPALSEEDHPEAAQQQASAGYTRNALAQLVSQEAPDATSHGLGASDPEAALKHSPKDVAEGIAPHAMADLLGENPGKGAGLLHSVGTSVSPRLVEVLGEMQAKAYATALGSKDDTEPKRLLREAAKLGYGGPFTSAEHLVTAAQRGLLRATDPKVQRDTRAIVEMAKAGARVNLDAGPAPLSADSVGAAWSHGSLAAMGTTALKEIRARHGAETAAAIAPSLRKTVKGPAVGLVPASDFHERQASTRNRINDALAQVDGAPHVAPSPQTVATLAVLARHADDVATGINGSAKALVTGDVPTELRFSGTSTRDVLKMMDSVRRLASDPHRLVDALDHHTATLADHAPQTGQATATTLSAGVQYLASQLPEGRAPTLQDPKGGQPSSSAIASWGRKADAILHPREVLARGPSPEAVAALQAVYPGLWSQWRASAVNALASEAADGRPPSFQALQRVSTAIGQPLVPAQSQAMLAIAPVPSPRPPVPPGTPSKAGLAKADFSAGLRTGTQRVEAGGERG